MLRISRGISADGLHVETLSVASVLEDRPLEAVLQYVEAQGSPDQSEKMEPEG